MWAPADWKGHVLPGTIFILWGLHWLQGSLRLYFSQNPEKYRSLACYGLPGSPPWPLEGVFKMALAFLGGWMELTFMKRDGFTRLICKPGTPREGFINGGTVHNWQHFVSYVGFFVSGAVDIINYFLPGLSLPEDVEKVFLGLAFFNEAMLMFLHEKKTPLDRLMHQTLAYAMFGTALPIWAEVVWPQSFLATMCRVGGALGQGVIFWVIAQTIKMDDVYIVEWDQTNGQDQVLSSYAAVIFVQCFVGLQCLFTLTVALFSCRFKQDLA
ncbi:hypothetical protein DUNSADRAFT_16905 [Dunaliella salina]|uniref:Transmembrane protein 45B n=1 Tax=Dunaliella salina TaxID=3046 RepID=A0ABQ7H979_DUNSA|nr:hypothetical protein DUNSADRAFT_16905 [Dunaliella salina]|eukprot:KAF5843406.1 hypothetical protein DUNSADRAFT_16905 [Dunaliella salina]